MKIPIKSAQSDKLCASLLRLNRHAHTFIHIYCILCMSVLEFLSFICKKQIVAIRIHSENYILYYRFCGHIPTYSNESTSRSHSHYTLMVSIRQYVLKNKLICIHMQVLYMYLFLQMPRCVRSVKQQSTRIPID